MYILHEDVNDPTILTTLEEGVGEEAINQHNRSEHVLIIVQELRKQRESTEINIQEVAGFIFVLTNYMKSQINR